MPVLCDICCLKLGLHNQVQDHSTLRGGYLDSDLIIFCNLGYVCSASASLPALKSNLFKSGVRPLAAGDREKEGGRAMLREHG